MPRPRDEYDAEDDDRPRRRRFEDAEDDDDRPRRRPRRKPAGPPVGLIVGLVAGGGLLALFILVGVGYILLRQDRPAPAATRVAVAPAAPAVAPPAAKAAPAGQQQVTITAVRRGTGFAGKPTLEIDYTLTGGMIPGPAVVLVKSQQGTTEANIFGMMGMRPGEKKGTWTLEKFGFAGGGFGGRLEVWVEQRLGFSGGIISNTFVLEAP